MNHEQTQIDPVGNQWQFSCECGVVGELRDNRSDAEADIIAHIQTAREPEA